MENTQDHRYEVDETVVIYPGTDKEHLGIIKEIKHPDREHTDYLVQDNTLHSLPFHRKDLGPSEVQLHKRAFKPKMRKDVIRKDGNLYVIEQTGWDYSKKLNSDDLQEVYRVVGRKVGEDGKYDPDGEIVTFEKGYNEHMDVLNKLERAALFE
jgi:hypothetical protein